MKLYLPIGDNVLGENVYNIVGRELSCQLLMCYVKTWNLFIVNVYRMIIIASFFSKEKQCKIIESLCSCASELRLFTNL